MKKVFLSLAIILGLSFLTKAQNNTNVITLDNNPHRYQVIDNGDFSQRFKQNSNRREAGGWYQFAGDYANANGLSYNPYVVFVFPDSVHIMYEDQLGRSFTQLIGTVFDPKDKVFIDENTGTPRYFSRWTNYTLDSIYWSQAYIRQVDSMDVVNSVYATATITVLDYTQLSTAELSIGVAPMFTTLTQGSEWNAAGDNYATATSIKDALVAAGYTATVVDSIITVQAKVIGVAGNSYVVSSNDASLEITNQFAGGGDNVTKVEIVDTLYIQHFTGESNNIEIRGLNFQNDAQTYYAGMPAIENYVPSTIMNTGAYRTDTIFLTKDMQDSITEDLKFRSRSLVIGVGKQITGSNNIPNTLYAVSFLFKPMKKYTFNDTLISLDKDVTVSNKHNLLGISYYAQDGQTLRIVDAESINNMFATQSDLRYGAAGQGGWKSYRPFLQGFSGTFFHATPGSNLDVFTPNAGGYGMGDAYPNPTDNAISFAVPFSIGAAQTVTFIVKDITGRTVKTVSADYAAGNNFVEIETIGLNAGVYFYTMNTENYSATGKVIIK
ncbi:MAG: T9SS type A sorting domain-containing protein [Bacteroidetes bacterium]|nr:T9SS type A sorting domain-containing protein [Bacteroidota bacterium]